MPVLLVMLGGALGSAARYLTGRLAFALAGDGWPWGTLAVNIVGGFGMGLLAGFLARSTYGEMTRLFVGVGLLGGFTTFSAFSLEVVLMIERGSWASAFGYALASVVAAVTALFAGLALVRGLA